MQFKGRVGRQSLSNGSVATARQNVTGDLVLEQGGKYTDAALAGRLFSICNQAKVATTAALATTYTGLAIGNPSSSGMNMKVLRFGFGQQIACDDDGAIGLMVGNTSLTTSLTPIARLWGGPASRAIATAGQTIGTPVLYDIFGDYGTANTNTLSTAGAHIHDLDGSLVLEPGFYVAAYATTATTAALIFSFLWEEVLT